MVQDFQKDMIDIQRYLNLRYEGTDVAMMTQSRAGQSYAEVIHGKVGNPCTPILSMMDNTRGRFYV